MTSETNSGERTILLAAYRGFNARQIDAVLALMHPDVVWPNGMDGGYEHGREAVRAYWTRQWLAIDPHVEPVAIEPDAQGRMIVEVHQVVRDKSGAILVDTMVRHAYTLRDGLIERMAIE
jgi:hypothetical protein